MSRASVAVGGETIGRIGRGFCILAGFTQDDTEEKLRWMAEKIIGLRLFADRDDKMNLALAEISGSLLVISQFTLYGDVQKGRRPSFIDAAPPAIAEPLYERFLALLRELGASVESGRFGAMMDVELVNDGPVTLVLEK